MKYENKIISEFLFSPVIIHLIVYIYIYIYINKVYPFPLGLFIYFPLYITIKAYAILYRGRGNTERDKAKYEMANKIGLCPFRAK